MFEVKWENKSTTNEENFNVKYKADVFKYKDKTGCGFGSLIEKFSVGKTQILNILKNRGKILREFESIEPVKTKKCS